MKNDRRQPVKDQAAGNVSGNKLDKKIDLEQDMDRSFLRKAICWAEILEKPVCRRRRERIGNQSNIGRR